MRMSGFSLAMRLASSMRMLRMKVVTLTVAMARNLFYKVEALAPILEARVSRS